MDDIFWDLYLRWYLSMGLGLKRKSDKASESLIITYQNKSIVSVSIEVEDDRDSTRQQVYNRAYSSLRSWLKWKFKELNLNFTV
jgi:hypothetical protein